jgi:hypothetical protein
MGLPMASVGLATPGNSAFAIAISGATPQSVAALGLSLGASTPSTSGCSVVIDTGQLLPLPVAPLGVAVTVTDSFGSASIGIPLPNAGVLLGFAAYAQWAVLDPLGLFQIGGQSYSLSRGRKIILW